MYVTSLNFNIEDYSKLGYLECNQFVKLYHYDIFVGNLLVYKDSVHGGYIKLNSENVYLKSITKYKKVPKHGTTT